MRTCRGCSDECLSPTVILVVASLGPSPPPSHSTLPFGSPSCSAVSVASAIVLALADTADDFQYHRQESAHQDAHGRREEGLAAQDDLLVFQDWVCEQFNAHSVVQHGERALRRRRERSRQEGLGQAGCVLADRCLLRCARGPTYPHRLRMYIGLCGAVTRRSAAAGTRLTCCVLACAFVLRIVEDGGPALPKDSRWLKERRAEGFVIFPGLPNGSHFSQGSWRRGVA